MNDAQSPRARRPSLADVGRVAEVSAQTVSRYFTGSGAVGPETRERIEQAIAQLGYRRNLMARNLRTQQSDILGLLTFGPINFGGTGSLDGMTHTAADAGFTLVTTRLEHLPTTPQALAAAKRALDNLLSLQVAGLVVSTPFEGAEQLLDHVDGHVPTVTISGRPRTPDDSVTIDFYSAGLAATRHLLELGHRRILHLGGPADRVESVERERGYRDAMTGAGLRPLAIPRAREWDADSGYELAQLVDPNAFTGVFSANDELALGFMAAFREKGREAPHDYSIVGVDDMPEARYFTPPLTTARLDFVELGRVAIRALLAQVNGGTHSQRIVLETELIVRDSTGPVAAARAESA